MTSEPFCPRLPLDPFAAIDHDIPWSIPQNLPLSHPQVILVLGEPPNHDLIPLLTSIHLSRSLVLIATDTPPLIPANTRGPAVRILRLLKPLAAHDAGALRLVSLFQRAQRAAHLWPRYSSPHIIQLAQPSPDGDFSIIEPVSYAHPSKKSGTTELRRYPSPAPSASEAVPSSKRQSALFPSSASTHSPHKKLHRKSSPLKISDDNVNYKPFDAIINFLPHGLPDKILLKHVILVTTLSAQFLAPPTTTSPFFKADPKTYYSHSPTTIQTQKSSMSMPFPSVSSHSHSYSSASQSTSSPFSESTPDTSPCPLPPPRLSKSWDPLGSPTSTSGVKNRLSLLFHVASPPPPPRPELQPTEISNKNASNDRPRKVKNAHLVHVLPMDWSGSESDRGSKCISSPLKSGESSRRPHSTGHFKSSSGTGKPKLVQSIEQFLLSFAYPLGRVVSGSGLRPGSVYSDTNLPSPSSSAPKRPKSAQILSSTAIIKEESIATPRPRPRSSLVLKDNAKAYEQENSPLRASTLPTLPSSSSVTISSNINTPLKSVPYLLAPGIFGRCVLGSGGSNVRSGRSSLLSECGVDQYENNEEDTRGSTYMADPEATALTIGEIILLGALDFDHTCPGTGPGNGRAWIGNVGDVVIVGGGPDRGLNSRKKAKGREVVAVINTETTKTANRTVNVGLPTPPESSSSNISAESEGERQEEEMSSVGHTQRYAQPIPLVSAYSSPSHLDDIRDLHRQDQAGTRSGEKVNFNGGVGEALAVVMSPTSTIPTVMKPKATGARSISSSLPSTSAPMSDCMPSPKSTPTSRPTSQLVTIPGSRKKTPNKLSKRKPSSSFSTPSPTSASTILNSKQKNSTSHVIKDKNKNSLSSPSLALAVQAPPLVIRRDRARSPRGPEDNYDLRLGHGVPVPPVMVSKKPGSRSASGSGGLGSDMILPQTQGNEARRETRSSMNLLEEPRKGSEWKGFVGALRKMGLWKSGNRDKLSVGLGSKP